jgi:biopolymer transport protein ExbB/TolQ
MTLLHAYQEGGWGMHPILVLAFASMYIVVERVQQLYFKMNLNKEHFFKNLTTYLLKGDLEGMLVVCDQNPAPLSKVIKACLIKLINRGTDSEIQAALDEGAMIETPKIERKIGYLAVFGNVATLVGLLGTISGLILSFAAVANADAATKAAKLTAGIAEAMHCTAFGLIVAVPCVLAFAFLHSRAQHLIDDINEISIRTLNFILANRERFGVTTGSAEDKEAA